MLISPIFFLNRGKSRFLWIALLFKHFFRIIQPNMSEQEKKQPRIYDLLNAKKNFRNNWSFFMTSIKPRT